MASSSVALDPKRPLTKKRRSRTAGWFLTCQRAVAFAALLVVSPFSLCPSSHVAAFCPHRRIDEISFRTTQPPLKQAPWQDIVSQLSSKSSSSDTVDADADANSGSDGSILGASLLFAGTAIGAGMLALPAETLNAGFIPSISGLGLCWAFTYITSLVTLEASWTATRASIQEGESSEGEGGFLSISKRALGTPGEIVTAVLFWFLLTSIVVAYTSEGGQLISQFVSEIGESAASLLPDLSIAPAFGSAIFAAFFGTLATYGTSRVDSINRIFVLGLLATFLGLVGFGLPQIDTANLLSTVRWDAVYPTGISIGILSFGAQNIVPTLLKYLGGDPNRTRRAILFGSLTPLVMYTIWEAVFLGIVSADAAAVATGESKMQVVTVLGETGGTIVKDLVEVFSACAIGSSMAGASVSLVDFFQDALGIASKMNDKKVKVEESPSPKDTSGIFAGAGSTRLLATALALGPPVILAYAFPDIFLVALEEAGLLGGVSLYGILPTLSILSLRRSSQDDATMPGRVGGGDIALYALVAISSGLVLPEVVRLGTMHIR